MIKTLDLNVSGTKTDVAPKQTADRFLSIGDHIQVTATFEYIWETPRYTSEVLKNLRNVFDF